MSSKFYYAYGSTDEGFRYPIDTVGAIVVDVERLKKELEDNPEWKGWERRSVSEMSEEEIENIGCPECHGKLIEVWGEDFSKAKTSNGAAYDWVFIYEIEAV